MLFLFHTSLEIFATLYRGVMYEIAKGKMSLYVAAIPLNHNRRCNRDVVGIHSRWILRILQPCEYYRRQLASPWRPQCTDEILHVCNPPRLIWIFCQMIAPQIAVLDHFSRTIRSPAPRNAPGRDFGIPQFINKCPDARCTVNSSAIPN